MRSDLPTSPVRVRTFFVGGSLVAYTGRASTKIRLSPDLAEYAFDPTGTYPAWHALVEHREPDPAVHLPVVLLHGGSLSAACWSSTPDGREGWTGVLTGGGWPVYTVDRAGWSTAPGSWDGPAIMRPAEEMWANYRIGPAANFTAREPFPGTQFPAGAFDAAVRYTVPRLLATSEHALATLTELLDRIGRCVLVGHSHGGGLAAHLAVRHPDRVAAVVLLEPHGMPAVPAAVPQLLVHGDYLADHPVYAPLMGIWARYRDNAVTGGAVDMLDLPARGHRGNSHMLMWDRNSERVATLITDWLVEVGAGDPA